MPDKRFCRRFLGETNMLIPINPERLNRAKRAFSTRNVPESALHQVQFGAVTPKAGDLVLARITELGQHKTVELPTSRKATLFVGDEVILAFGNRYAPDQFEAFVPGDLGPCEMVAGGGIAGRVALKNTRMNDATKIEPIGVFVDDQHSPINVRDFALRTSAPMRPVTGIAVVGGSMNAGKTTTAANLIHGLTRAGYKVGAAKITGTGAGNDFWHMKDAGAVAVYDFTDAGLATTYRASQFDLERCADTLAAALVQKGCDVIVYEIADGLFQEETAWLVQSRTLRRLIGGYVYAGESAASTAMGVQWLRQYAQLLLGVSGLVSASPLASREVENATGYPCLTKEALAHGDIARKWMSLLVKETAVAA
jgi:hypothetical protein